MTTNHIDTIRERLKELRTIRTQHMYDTGDHAPDPGLGTPTYLAGNHDALFRDYDDMQYYERLTGHIEELEYLLKALK